MPRFRNQSTGVTCSSLGTLNDSLLTLSIPPHHPVGLCTPLLPIVRLCTLTWVKMPLTCTLRRLFIQCQPPAIDITSPDRSTWIIGLDCVEEAVALVLERVLPGAAVPGDVSTYVM